MLCKQLTPTSPSECHTTYRDLHLLHGQCAGAQIKRPSANAAGSLQWRAFQDPHADQSAAPLNRRPAGAQATAFFLFIFYRALNNAGFHAAEHQRAPLPETNFFMTNPSYYAGSAQGRTSPIRKTFMARFASGEHPPLVTMHQSLASCAAGRLIPSVGVRGPPIALRPHTPHPTSHHSLSYRLPLSLRSLVMISASPRSARDFRRRLQRQGKNAIGLSSFWL